MSRDTRRLSLVAYDITDDRRRDRIAKILERYGDRVQYSVFLIDTSPAKVLRLRSELERQIRPLEDSVMICDLGPATVAYDQVSWLGRQRITTDVSSLII